jgi:hypothetical protein
MGALALLGLTSVFLSNYNRELDRQLSSRAAAIADFLAGSTWTTGRSGRVPPAGERRPGTAPA